MKESPMLDNYKKILVGIDGSVEATKAFDKAVATALRNDAELVIANVIDLRAFQSISAYDSVVADDTHKGAENLINDFADEAKKAGVKKVKTRVEFGSPKVMLGQTLPKEEETQWTEEEKEKALLLQTLEKTGDNRSKAARLLNVSRTTLYEKLRKYHIID